MFFAITTLLNKISDVNIGFCFFFCCWIFMEPEEDGTRPTKIDRMYH